MKINCSFKRNAVFKANHGYGILICRFLFQLAESAVMPPSGPLKWPVPSNTDIVKADKNYMT